MFTTIAIIAAVAFVCHCRAADQARRDEYYQEQAEAERQRAIEHDARMGRKVR